MISRTSYILVSFVLFFLTACQSSPVRQFERVHAGMDKQQVLDAMGSPSGRSRLHGKDRWIYVFYDDGIRFEKEVHFLEGAAVYVGDTWKPPVEKTAVAADTRNEEINKQAEAEEEQRAKEKRQNAQLFFQYEKEVRGRDTIKTMPVFTEVK